MDERIREHVAKYNESKGWGATDEQIIETIIESEHIYREELHQSRWWNVYLYVVDIGGMLIGYDYAEANRDMSVRELGFDFEESSIREMVPVEKTIITYEPK